MVAPGWQDFNGRRHFCHSWLDLSGSRVSAMDIFWLVLTVLAAAALVAWLVALARLVGDDGLGHRPPPPSHADAATPRLAAR